MSVQRLVSVWLPCMAVTLLLSGCASVKAPFVPPSAGIVTTFSAPLQFNFGEDGAAVVAESGSASSMYFHDPILTGMSFAWDDCSIEEAARNGKIKTVHYADYKWFSVLGIVCKTTVTVYGTR
ncbi:MAG: hypothetical protein BWY57_02527 [Betaproteobacteria bacterium ADurb.Bin341]|nr:MAG: hypothetical protein BWY57_02527 [Betaproteobacteria bacterium ADurb.Bin341]